MSYPHPIGTRVEVLDHRTRFFVDGTVVGRTIEEELSEDGNSITVHVTWQVHAPNLVKGPKWVGSKLSDIRPKITTHP